MFSGAWLLPTNALTFAVLFFSADRQNRQGAEHSQIGAFTLGFCAGFTFHFANPNEQVMLP